jgi:hypothetical protein
MYQKAAKVAGIGGIGTHVPDTRSELGLDLWARL